MLYQEFLAKKVAKVFPALVPETYYKSLTSTSAPSTRHALVVDTPEVTVPNAVRQQLEPFFARNPRIKPSHGLAHALAVGHHATLACQSADLDAMTTMEVVVAALLHDVDDRKYFPQQQQPLENARGVMAAAGVPAGSWPDICFMIEQVSCSKNGNKVPRRVAETGDYHLLIPRWADRLEAVGPVGVVRSYRYNLEAGVPLSSEVSPRPASEE